MSKERKYIIQKLEEYHWICDLIECTESDLGRWINEAEKVISDMSTLNTKELRTLYMGICERLNRQIKELTKAKILIDNAINTIEDSDIKQIIKLKYIEFLKWPKISDIINLPVKQCHELHEKGLELLENILTEAA